MKIKRILKVAFKILLGIFAVLLIGFGLLLWSWNQAFMFGGSLAEQAIAYEEDFKTIADFVLEYKNNAQIQCLDLYVYENPAGLSYYDQQSREYISIEISAAQKEALKNISEYALNYSHFNFSAILAEKNVITFISTETSYHGSFVYTIDGKRPKMRYGASGEYMHYKRIKKGWYLGYED